MTKELGNDKKDQFYFHGKIFDNPEDMFKWAKEWENLSLNQETAENLFDRLKREIIMNIFLLGKEFTNKEFQNFLEDMFQYAIHKIYGKND